MPACESIHLEDLSPEFSGMFRIFPLKFFRACVFCDLGIWHLDIYSSLGPLLPLS